MSSSPTKKTKTAASSGDRSIHSFFTKVGFQPAATRSESQCDSISNPTPTEPQSPMGKSTESSLSAIRGQIVEEDRENEGGEDLETTQPELIGPPDFLRLTSASQPTKGPFPSKKYGKMMTERCLVFLLPFFLFFSFLFFGKF